MHVRLFAALAVSLATAVFSDSGERRLATAMLDAAEEKEFAATQLLSCRQSDGREFFTTASIAGDLSHGVAVSHAFFDSKSNRFVSAVDCKFAVHDRAGAMIDQVPIVNYRARWREDNRRGPGSDLAMFELARAPRGISQAVPIAETRIQNGADILLVAFHFDAKPATAKRKTHGHAYSNAGTDLAGVPNVFITDLDAAPMASGGPIYTATGTPVGLFYGSTSRVPDTVFDGTREFRIAVRFDARFVREFEEFAQPKR